MSFCLPCLPVLAQVACAPDALACRQDRQAQVAGQAREAIFSTARRLLRRAHHPAFGAGKNALLATTLSFLRKP